MTEFIEIAACIASYYFINSLLFNQQDKKLLFYWYGYHALVVSAYILELQTLFFIASCCFPIVLMLAIMLHEQRIQKMFVVAQRLDALTNTSIKSHWVDELIKFALTRLNEQKDLQVLIENRDTLNSLITAQELINADLKKNTLDLLYDSFIMPPGAFLWVTNSGKIVALAARCKHQDLHDALTKSTDCIIFKAETVTRRFTIQYGSKILENLSAHHALNLLHELALNSTKKEAHTHAQKTYSAADMSQNYNDTTFSS